MRNMARQRTPREVEAGIRLRRLLIQRDRTERAKLREGLIYTRRGVLDMTRRHKPERPAPELIVGWIGGAKGW